MTTPTAAPTVPRLRTAAAAVLAPLLALLLAACGSTHVRQGGLPDPGEIPWTSYGPSRVDAVRVTDAGRTVTLDVQVPAGPHDCVRGLHAEVEGVRGEAVDVRVTFESPVADRRSGCTENTTVTVTGPLPEPVGDRTLVVDSTSSFTASGATPPALRPCGQLGCHPAPTGCTPSSYEQALTGADSPRHTTWKDRGCDGRWLVLDLSAPAGPVCGDPGPGCDSAARTTRWYYRASSTGWSVVTTDAGAGCTGVHRVEPAFPDRLCAALPALTP